MGDGWKSKLLVTGWAAFLGALTFLAWSDFALVANAKWCGNADQHCLRDWIGATSGWAAALAAGITIFLLYRQNAEQKKQSDFAVGDARPTITVIQDLSDSEMVVIRVVNWNRRSLLFRRLDIDGIDVAWIPMETEISRPGGLVNVQDQPFNRLYLRGWEDRNRPPEVLQIKIAALAPRQDNLVTDWPESAHVAINAVLIAERHEPLKLKGHLLGAGR